MEQKIVVNGKEYIVKPLMYSDMLDYQDISGSKAKASFILEKRIGLTKEQFDKLEFNEGIAIQTAINNLDDQNQKKN